MQTQKIQVKLYATDEAKIDLPALVPVLHGWIREKKVEDALVDVANYDHVPKGPGVVLIGVASDYYLDLGEGRPGLLYSRKREAEGSLRERVADAFRRAFVAASLLESEEALELRFGTSEILFRIPDRLNAPNEDATLEEVRPVLDEVLGTLFGSGAYELERAGEPRDVFTVRIRIKASGEGTHADLAAKL
jgi:hypothetical protein